MKLGPVSKLEKRNKITSREFDDDVMSVNCEDIVIFSIYSQFGAVQNLISGQLQFVVTYIFINSNILSYKNTNALSKGTIFAKNAGFLQKKIKKST